MVSPERRPYEWSLHDRMPTVRDRPAFYRSRLTREVGHDRQTGGKLGLFDEAVFTFEAMIGHLVKADSLCH